MLFSWDIARHTEIERLARATIITDEGMRHLTITFEELLAQQGFDVQQPYSVRDIQDGRHHVYQFSPPRRGDL